MKKIIIAAVAVAFLTLSLISCGGMGGSKAIKTDTDSASYAHGIDLGMYVKNMDSSIDRDMVIAAIKDVLNEKEKLTRDEAFAFLREYYEVKMPAKNLIASAEYLEKVQKENKKAIKTESGLIYEVIKEGDNTIMAVEDNDVVKVIYEGKLKDGKVFDSSIERGDTAEFPLDRVIKGWTEGLKLVGKGGTIKLWVPAELGYGEQGNQAIGPNEALTFEVTLVDVIVTPQIEAPVVQ